MSFISQTEISILVDLLLAALLGGAIGLERELAHHSAGLRTNMLVCIGSTIFSTLALSSFGSLDAAARIIANILVGIGFLGSGAVIKAERTVHGLTTAATIWIVAAVGVAVAVHMYFLAVTSTILVLIVLWFIRRFERPDSPPARF